MKQRHENVGTIYQPVAFYNGVLFQYPSTSKCQGLPLGGTLTVLEPNQYTYFENRCYRI